MGPSLCLPCAPGVRDVDGHGRVLLVTSPTQGSSSSFSRRRKKGRGDRHTGSDEPGPPPRTEANETSGGHKSLAGFRSLLPREPGRQTSKGQCRCLEGLLSSYPSTFLIPLPALCLRLLGVELPPIYAGVVFGAAVVASAVILAWAAEAAQLDISGSLAIALLALIAVLPEYAVDLYFAYTAGHDPEFISTPPPT